MSYLVKIGKNSLFYWLSSAVPMLVGFFLLPVYTRYMTPSDYGILGMLAMVASPLGVIFTLQLNTAVLRYFFNYEGEERKKYLGTMLIFLMIYALPLTLCLIFFGEPLFRIIFKSANLTFYPFVVWQIIITYLSLTWIIPSVVFKARQQALRWVLFTLVSFVLGTGSTLYFIIVAGEGAMGVVRASLITQSIMTVAYIYVIVRNISFRFDWGMLKESLLFSLPMFPNAFIGMLFSFADRWFLERYYTLAEVGLYTMAQRFGQLVNMLYTAISEAWMPVFFNTANQDEAQAKAILSRTITLWVAGGGLVTLLIAFFCREVIIVMTTPEFHPAYTIVPVLVFSGLLAGISLFLRYAILYVKQTKVIPIIALVSGGIKVLASYLLIPHYGMFGAVYAGLISTVVALAIVYVIIRRYYPFKYEYAKLVTVLVMVVVFVAGIYFLPNARWYILIPIKLGALVVYSLGLFYFGVIEKELLVRVKNSLNWKAFISILKD